MSGLFDPLETELQSLRPCDASPHLRRRIAERLNVRQAQASNRPWPWSVALAGALAAAAVAAVLVWSEGRLHQEPWPGETERPGRLAVRKDAPPTVLAYKRVLARSPNALEALLDQHAARVLPATSPRPEFRAFARIDELRFDPALGEL
jgi:hypothetical protein